MKKFYRKATSKELKFYQKEVYSLQDKIFKIASVYEDKIYLTGGTALSRFYFNHRLSEDLDFFTTTNDLKLIANDLIGRLKDEGFSIEINKLDVYFSRFTIDTQKFSLKIELVKEHNQWGSLTKTAHNIFINSLEDIGANKITAFEDRAEFKDIIDLYYITKKLTFDRLFEIAETKRIPIPYEELLTINTLGITGKVLMIDNIDEQLLTNFVKELKLKTEEEIKKKEELAARNLEKIIQRNLWDFPVEDRKLNQNSIPVLRRRLVNLPLPIRKALEKAILLTESY